MGHQLVAFLGRRIQADRIVHPVISAVWDLTVAPVHAGGTCIYQMPDAGPASVIGMAAGFKDIEEADQIALNIGFRVKDTVPHPCLSRKVHHNVGTVFLKNTVHCRPVGDIPPYEYKVRENGQPAQTLLLDLHIIIVVHTVYPDNPGTGVFLKEAQRKAGADETGRSRHEYCLGIQTDIVIQHNNIMNSH